MVFGENKICSVNSRWATSAAAVLYLTGSESVPEIFADREAISNILQTLKNMPAEWAKQICLTEIANDA